MSPFKTHCKNFMCSYFLLLLILIANPQKHININKNLLVRFNKLTAILDKLIIRSHILLKLINALKKIFK